MDRARDLFHRLETGGLAALEQLLLDAEPESLYLDFKRSVTRIGDRGLHKNDRDNLSKALSGFANCEGGLLIWGVSSSRDRGTQRESSEKAPVDDAAGFRTILEDAISGESIPAHTGARALHLLEGKGPEGYVALLIPASLIGPLRATRGDRYHLRSGSSFGVVPHAVLAGMFGRAPQPIVRQHLISYFTTLNERKDAISLSFGVAVGNFGAVLASKVFLTGWMSPKELSATIQTPFADAYDLRRGNLPGFSVIARDGVELAPGGMDELCTVHILIPLSYGHPIRLEFTLGARGAAPVKFYVGVDEATLRGLAERLAGGRVSTDEIWMTGDLSVAEK